MKLRIFHNAVIYSGLVDIFDGFVLNLDYKNVELKSVVPIIHGRNGLGCLNLNCFKSWFILKMN